MLSLLDNSKSFKLKNRRAWGKSWEYWYKKEYIHQGIKEYLQQELKSIKEAIGKLNILDLGCGSAWPGRFFSSNYDRYLGIDFNRSLIKRLKQDFKNRPQLDFISFDIESTRNWPVKTGAYDLILCSFIVLELSDLKAFFTKAASIQKCGQFLIITGLDPLNEIVRVSGSLKEINLNLSTYRQAEMPVVLSKKMAFKDDQTKFTYYRILYSINDVVTSAVQAGYELEELNDQFNKNAAAADPIYYTIKLKMKCLK